MQHEQNAIKPLPFLLIGTTRLGFAGGGTFGVGLPEREDLALCDSKFRCAHIRCQVHWGHFPFICIVSAVAHTQLKT